MQVHEANLQDAREALNTLIHVGPDAVAAISCDIAAATAALRAAAPPPPPVSPYPNVAPRATPQTPASTPRNRGSTPRSASTLAPFASDTGGEADASQSSFAALPAHFLKHGELGMRATEAMLRSSFNGFSSASSSLTGRSERTDAERQPPPQ